MSKRPLNDVESKIHRAALTSFKNELTAKEVEALVPDPQIRQDALNFLLAAGIFKALQNDKRQISFRAISKIEHSVFKDLSGEENLVYGHIKTAHTEGIWVKHLKAKTNLHQTVIDRCVKTLVQKKLIKRVPSVQHPTRKIYMLEGLDPSIALTGGPWYTDNELDTEFIESLMKACHKFIRDVSFPNRRSHHPHLERALYPISNAPRYPTAQQVRDTLMKARLTETNLTVEHVEMLLNVLVLDGLVEKIPALSAAAWDLENGDDDEEDEELRHVKKKRKRNRHDQDRVDGHKSKRKRYSSSEDSEDESESDRPVKRSKKERGSDGSESEDRPRKKKAKRQQYDSDDLDSSLPIRRKSIKNRRQPSPDSIYTFGEVNEGSAFVYRAINEERMSLGWSQSPCGICPSFEFCKNDGPVNAKECIYYGDWLSGAVIGDIEDNVV